MVYQISNVPFDTFAKYETYEYKPGPLEVWLKDVIMLMLGYRGKWFDCEPAIRLYELMSWIYLSDKRSDAVVWGRAIAAIAFLEKIKADHLDHLDKRTNDLFQSNGMVKFKSKFHTHMTRFGDYEDIYDLLMSGGTGLSTILSVPRPDEFWQLILRNEKRASTVADLLAYRFRYLAHGGTDQRMTSLNRAFVFQSKAKDSPSGSTLTRRWNDFKYSSIFLYASRSLGLGFIPHDPRSPDFLVNLKRRSEDTDFMARFFGTCAYISDTLNPYAPEIALNDAFPCESTLKNRAGHKRAQFKRAGTVCQFRRRRADPKGRSAIKKISSHAVSFDAVILWHVWACMPGLQRSV